MANSFKLSTLLWFLAGLLIPLWPISLPVCWVLAYRSYAKGEPPAGRLADLQSAVELHKSGHLSDEELQRIKTTTLGGKAT